MERTEKLIKEFFPNMHAKTITSIGSIVGVLTYIFCSSGIF